MRIRALDGLRGAGALIVLLSHVALVATPLALSLSERPDLGSDWWPLVSTPLAVFWDGETAVHVFFVLSGLVLVRPFLRAGGDWSRYFPQRIARLYLPSLAGLALGAVLIWAVRGQAETGNPWLDTHLAGMTPWTLAQDALLVLGQKDAANTPLWSLQWEVLFSLLLPAFVWFARGGRAVPKVVGCLALSMVGHKFGVDWLWHMPLFGVGAVLAANLDQIRDRRALQSSWWLAVTWLLLAAPALMWVIDPVRVLPVALFTGAADVGATMAVVACLVRSPLAMLCETRPMQWAGTRSFSLYLTHAPIVIFAAFMWTAGPWLLAIIPVCLLVAEGFFRVVERPAHRYAKSVGPIRRALAAP